MHVRFTIFAAAALTLAATAVAQPADAPATAADRPSSRPAPVILASAGHVASPGAADTGQAPPKRQRAARITTCRCGGEPQAEVHDQGQE